MKGTTIITTVGVLLTLGAAAHCLQAEDITVRTKDGKEMSITDATVYLAADRNNHSYVPSRSYSTELKAESIYVTEPVRPPEGVTLVRKAIPMQQIQSIEWLGASTNSADPYGDPSFERGRLLMKDGKQKEYFLFVEADSVTRLHSGRVVVRGKMPLGAEVQDITFSTPDLKSLTFAKKAKK